MSDHESPEPLPRRRRPWRIVVWTMLGLLLLAAIWLWGQRREIASGFIQRELARRGVQASYEVTEIGFRTQRMEKVVIGDPLRPDATARWVEVEMSFGLRRPRVEKIIARGVRMRGRVIDGRLSLGEVDKMLPPPTGAPFRFPEQNIDIADAAIALDTAAGRLGVSIEGRGVLSDGFRGQIALASSRMTAEGCAVGGLRAFGTVATTRRSPSFNGPVNADRLVCDASGVELLRPRLALEASVPESFRSWRGKAALAVPQATIGGSRAAGLSGRVDFAGDAALTRGGVALAAARASFPQGRAASLSVDGRYALSPRTGQVSLLADAGAKGVVAAAAMVQPVTGALAGTDGTPIEPIAAALAGAVRRAAGGFDATGTLRLVNAPGFGAARIERLALASASGARLAIAGGKGLTYYWPAGRPRIDGSFALSGGGFPAARVDLAQAAAGAPIRGEARIAPMAAGGARLQLAPVRFSAGGRGGTEVRTVATIDGPFNDGRVDGLVVPIDGRLTGNGGFALGERCTTIAFRSLRAAGLTLGATQLPLCPTGRALLWRNPGGSVMAAADVARPRLSGRLGTTPVAATADRLRLSLQEPGFSGTGVTLSLGAPDRVNRLDLATLSGRFNARGVTGAYSGGSGKLANVPLLLSGANGDWSVLGGDLLVRGGLQVADDNPNPRFFPLTTNDFRLTLDGSLIEAGGTLRDPETGTLVSNVAISHALKTGAGNAVLDVPGIRFDENYQPEALTRLTTGVVALVNGTVTGRGEIVWGDGRTSSTGSFSTTDMSLAATFGPVEGLTTTIDFTDLLGLETAPGQVAQVGVIRTGIDVFDGLIRYQLLPDLRVKVEGGRWPYAGGELLLQETILDFSKDSPKNLTFALAGVDGATFVQQMEFTNIAATGTFDGVIPMIFDQGGGRIAGGRIAARPEGGTLSYIGELSDKQLGAYGKLAFDALKSLRYDKLSIGLDGSLDGEFLADIELDGVAREAPNPGGIVGAVFRQLAKIPLEFNIRVRGPFRAVLATTKSLEDPTQLIQSVLPEMLQDVPTGTTTVQPQESETVQ